MTASTSTLLLPLLALVALVGTACAAGDAVDETVGSVVDQVQDGIEAVPVAASLTCDAERRLLEAAVEAYTLLEGAAPLTEDDLVGDYLRETSALFDLDPAGAIVPAAGSTCS